MKYFMVKFGCLLLHGFTSSLDTVNRLIPIFEELELEYEMPSLRGHNTIPEDMIGVKYQDWIEDAELAYNALIERVDKVVILGLSMGGLVALQLAGIRSSTTFAIVTIAAAIQFKNPLARFSGLIVKVKKWMNSSQAFHSKEHAKKNTNYERYPSKSFLELYALSKDTINKLGNVTVPALIIHSYKDQIIHPKSASRIFEGISTPDNQKELKWFEKSGHEMLMDFEFKEVIEYIKQFLIKLSSLK